jgi:cytoskeletal protein RodZ
MKMNAPVPDMLGDYLQRERKSRHVTLTAISKALKVDSSWIDSLEHDDFNAFPNKKDIPDILRRYAKFLLLDENHLIRRYEIQSFAINSDKPTENLLRDGILKQGIDVQWAKKKSKRRALLLAFSFILVILLITLCIYTLSDKQPFMALKDGLQRIYKVMESRIVNLQ